MLLRFMSEFLAIMPTQLPDLLPKKTMEDPAVYDDYAQLVFHPSKRLTLAEVADQLEEQANLLLLYHRVVSDGLRGWQCCCAFSKPDNAMPGCINSTRQPAMTASLTPSRSVYSRASKSCVLRYDLNCRCTTRQEACATRWTRRNSSNCSINETIKDENRTAGSSGTGHHGPLLLDEGGRRHGIPSLCHCPRQSPADDSLPPPHAGGDALPWTLLHRASVAGVRDRARPGAVPHAQVNTKPAAPVP